jgi:PilZ domain
MTKEDSETPHEASLEEALHGEGQKAEEWVETALRQDEDEPESAESSADAGESAIESDGEAGTAEQVPDAGERRSEQRTKSKVKRTVLATVEEEGYEAKSNHLYIVDISENGIRINLDRVVEPDKILTVNFPLASLGYELEGHFSANCRVIWSRPLAGGTCILGMEFQGLSEVIQGSVDALIEHWGKKEGLDLMALPTPVDAKIRFEEGEEWSRMVAVRAISLRGFNFPSKHMVTEDQSIDVRLLLEGGTVETSAKVRWCKTMPNGVYDIGCEFPQLTEGEESYITLHLRRCRHKPIV